MGSFSKFWKGNNKSDSPPPPTLNGYTAPFTQPLQVQVIPPQPIWAVATEPSPRRNGFGPRPPSFGSTSSSKVTSAAMGPRPGTGSTGAERRRTGSLDDISHSISGLTITLTKRGPLPKPPPKHQRTYSSPSSIGPPPPHPESRLPRVPPAPSIRSAKSNQSGSSYIPSHQSTSSYAPSTFSQATTSYAPSSFGHATNSSHYSNASHTSAQSSIYPQALPSPPRISPPPLPPRGPEPYKQALPPSLPPSMPSSTTSTPGTTSAPFPGAFPLPFATMQMPEPTVQPLGRPTLVSCSSSPPTFLRRPPLAGNNSSDTYQHQGTKVDFPPWVTVPNAPPVRVAQSDEKISGTGNGKGGHGRLPRTPPANLVRRPQKKPEVVEISSDDDEEVEEEFHSSRSTPSKNSGSKKICSGTTATGKRCTRVIESSNSSPRRSSPEKVVINSAAVDVLDAMLSGEEGSEEEVPRFCFQHSKQSMQERGCFVNGKGGKGLWVEFDDWIMGDLPVVTKVLLRHEMARPVSGNDERGYLYVHEMVEKRHSSVPPDGSRTTFLKLGRSVKPVSRLSQWRSQCPSREPIVRDIFPRPSNTSHSNGSGISGALKIAPEGVMHHHRWERLVLVEVAGRSSEEGGKVRKECKDCGKKHEELFEVKEGAYDDWVRDVVERWMRWCGDVLVD